MPEVVTVEKKNILKSKTFWLNILAILNELIKFIPGLEDKIPTFSTEAVVVGLPLANIVMRTATKAPIVNPFTDKDKNNSSFTRTSQEASKF